MALLILLLAPITASGGDETCYPIPEDQWAPAGVAGCTLDGPTDGYASWYPGEFAAANWCLWPWTDCTPVTVQSHQTGITLTIQPQQFCHCYWQTDRRLIDLTKAQVNALGLDPEQGIFPVTVAPYPGTNQPRITLPNTKMDGCQPTELPLPTSGSMSKRLIPAGFGAALYGRPDTVRSCDGARTSTPIVTPMNWSKVQSLVV